MSRNCYVELENVNLHYPTNMYNAMTIKEEIFSMLKGERAKKELLDVHALKDLSFRLEEGERLGVIGHNGAGKSTLLKTLAGLYPISSGKIEVYGNVCSMFELTLGFEMESTGRENIMNRGLMLGKKPSEIKALEQEIIDFSELSDFIDYPIKSYSAGMLIRLAFAISTSVSGDILLIDEILAAGDASFQQKAKAKMADIMNKAQIMVLVSHDISAVKNLCNRCIMLEHGKIVADGKPEEVIDIYMNFKKIRMVID